MMSEEKRINEEELRMVHEKTEELKQKLNENEDLKKEIKNDGPIKKFGISSIVTATLLGICFAAKIDKKVAGPLAIASFIGSFVLQK